ncbi:DUF6417 family protein [Streptomyces sp. NPDC001922]|uniref:DUF6417 family protein n=1 Tax=Streptomyces sp. NPDC001922 TaxID=3364624 RepID=UPI0036B3D124
MGISDWQHTTLTQVRDGQAGTGHGWVTEKSGINRESVEALLRLGLCETADYAVRAVMEPQPVEWAARLTPDGHDVLLFATARRGGPPPHRTGSEPAPGRREVLLRPSEMTALRVFLHLAGRLRLDPAPGLADAVRDARFQSAENRWALHVTHAQMHSIARAFHLERLTGHATASNRFAREYGVRYPPEER